MKGLVSKLYRQQGTKLGHKSRSPDTQPRNFPLPQSLDSFPAGGGEDCEAGEMSHSLRKIVVLGIIK